VEEQRYTTLNSQAYSSVYIGLRPCISTTQQLTTSSCIVTIHQPYLQYATQNQEKANCYATTSTKRQSNSLTNQLTIASHLPNALAIQIYVVTKELTNWPKQQPNNLEHQTLPQPICSNEPENASQKHGLKLGRTILNRDAILKQTGFPSHLDQHPILKTLETNGNYLDT